jgi:hypothetical protein
MVEILEVQYGLDFNGDGIIGATTLTDQLITALGRADAADPVIGVDDGDVTLATTNIEGAGLAMDALNGKTAKVNITADDTAFWNTIGGIPSIVGDRYINVHGIGFQAEAATGGAIRFATGGMARLAEMGPELVHYPSGATGLAMRDGLYGLPSGAMVDTAAATKEKLRTSGGGDIHINAPVYVYPPTADIHEAIVSAALNQAVG